MGLLRSDGLGGRWNSSPGVGVMLCGMQCKRANYFCTRRYSPFDIPRASPKGLMLRCRDTDNDRDSDGSMLFSACFPALCSSRWSLQPRSCRMTYFVHRHRRPRDPLFKGLDLCWELSRPRTSAAREIKQSRGRLRGAFDEVISVSESPELRVRHTHGFNVGFQLEGSASRLSFTLVFPCLCPFLRVKRDLPPRFI